jgi:hypothetical protein
VDFAHPKASDIFAVAPTSTQLLSASGSSSINVYDTAQTDFPVIQTLDQAHPLGIHHLVTAREDKARRAASAGFEGKVKIWSQNEDGVWSEDGEIVGGYALRFHCEIVYHEMGVSRADLRCRPEQARRNMGHCHQRRRPVSRRKQHQRQGQCLEPEQSRGNAKDPRV